MAPTFPWLLLAFTLLLFFETTHGRMLDSGWLCGCSHIFSQMLKCLSLICQALRTRASSPLPWPFLFSFFVFLSLLREHGLVQLHDLQVYVVTRPLCILLYGYHPKSRFLQLPCV